MHFSHSLRNSFRIFPYDIFSSTNYIITYYYKCLLKLHHMLGVYKLKNCSVFFLLMKALNAFSIIPFSQVCFIHFIFNMKHFYLRVIFSKCYDFFRLFLNQNKALD